MNLNGVPGDPRYNGIHITIEAGEMAPPVEKVERKPVPPLPPSDWKEFIKTPAFQCYRRSLGNPLR